MIRLFQDKTKTQNYLYQSFNKLCFAGVRNDFAAQLHKFMACLTDTAYKMEGKTVLYIPEEDISSGSKELCSKNKELVSRLESKYKLQYPELAQGTTTNPLFLG